MLPSNAFRWKSLDMIEVYKHSQGASTELMQGLLEFTSDTRTREHSLKLI